MKAFYKNLFLLIFTLALPSFANEGNEMNEMNEMNELMFDQYYMPSKYIQPNNPIPNTLEICTELADAEGLEGEENESFVEDCELDTGSYFSDIEG